MYIDDRLMLYDESTDVLFDVLTETRTVDDVARLARSFEFLGDEKADVLAAVCEDQFLRLRLERRIGHHSVFQNSKAVVLNGELVIACLHFHCEAIQLAIR